MAVEKHQTTVEGNLDTPPILYTENIVISASEDGVVLNIGQKIVATRKLRVVSRVGMSRVHAKKFLKSMGSLLAMTEGDTQTGNKEKN